MMFHPPSPPHKKRITKSCSSSYIIINLSTSFGHTAITLDPHLLNYWSLHFIFAPLQSRLYSVARVSFFLSFFNENLIATPLLETLSMVCHALCDIGPAHLSRLLSNHSDYSTWSCRSTCLLFIPSICQSLTAGLQLKSTSRKLPDHCYLGWGGHVVYS